MDFKSIKNLGLPFYKDPMSHGNLIIEFLVDFPKRNSLSKDAIEKIRLVFKQPASASANTKVLE